MLIYVPTKIIMNKDYVNKNWENKWITVDYFVSKMNEIFKVCYIKKPYRVKQDTILQPRFYSSNRLIVRW